MNGLEFVASIVALVAIVAIFALAVYFERGFRLRARNRNSRMEIKLDAPMVSDDEALQAPVPEPDGDDSNT